MTLVVGFDLDMTLVDSGPGIAATLGALAAETGVDIDPRAVIDLLTASTIDAELHHWYGDDAPRMADRFRELYSEHGVPGTFIMPGARESIDAVRARDGRVLVVTAKYEPNARRCLDFVGLQADAVFGWKHGAEKGAVLVEEGAQIYVGDTLGDVEGALFAAATSVAIPSGPHSGVELRAAGAHVVLDNLTEFPTWLETYSV